MQVTLGTPLFLHATFVRFKIRQLINYDFGMTWMFSWRPIKGRFVPVFNSYSLACIQELIFFKVYFSQNIQTNILYHCLSKSAMYKQKKSLLQITLLERPLPIKWQPQSIIYYLPLEIHLCDFKLLLAEFKKCKGVLIAFLHFTFLNPP